MCRVKIRRCLLWPRIPDIFLLDKLLLLEWKGKRNSEGMWCYRTAVLMKCCSNLPTASSHARGLTNEAIFHQCSFLLLPGSRMPNLIEKFIFLSSAAWVGFQSFHCSASCYYIMRMKNGIRDIRIGHIPFNRYIFKFNKWVSLECSDNPGYIWPIKC